VPQPTRRRPNRAEKREANRARIQRAARSVFGARGFHAATIEEIADEAGLSNGAIYYNFESKGDLFFALLEERQDERIRHIRETFTSAPRQDAALEAETRDVTHSLKANREWWLLLLEFIVHAARSPKLAPKLQTHTRAFKTALAELLEQRFGQRGVALSLPIDDLALAATALADGLALAELSDPGSVRDELLGDLFALLVGDATPAEQPRE
jgi:AcrR family transcriptional regulator